jgi:hypothetical protein
LFLPVPPNVSVIATNTTVKETNTVLRCIAKGVPDNNYRYGKWIQRWPGYAVPVSVRPGSETLELTDLTYEHSGFYTCTSSNGIKVFGTNTEFIEGKEGHLLVKCKIFFDKCRVIIYLIVSFIYKAFSSLLLLCLHFATFMTNNLKFSASLFS